MPIWLFLFLGLALYWGFSHLESTSGGFSSLVYANYKSVKQLDDLQPKDESQKAFLAGKEVYGRTCVACHQPTGAGVPGQFPPLAASDWVSAKSPERLIRVVLDGLQGPIQVNGQDWNNVMVKWRGVLSAEEVANVLTYVRAEWGNKSAPVTVEHVKKVMEETASQSEAWTGPELMKIPVD